MSLFTLPWLYPLLTGIYILSVVTVILVILAENRNPVKSLAWVTILVLLPAAGLVLYFFFGRNIKNTRMISRKNKRRLRRREDHHVGRRAAASLPSHHRQLIQMVGTINGAVYYPDNDIRFFNCGADKFSSLADDLRQARESIHIQYYIFENDHIGQEIAQILMEKARAGVKVRVIYDHVGSYSVKSRFFRQMKEAGVEIHPFFRVTFPLLSSRINWRNHRKIAIIDGQIGYIGGMNIADRYINGGKDFPLWRDLHARLTGPGVQALQNAFAVDWTFMGQPMPETECWPQLSSTGATGFQMITSGPMDHWQNVAHTFLRAIGMATNRIYIQTPYFLPTEGLLHALQAASLSGVDVRIMIPQRCDSRLLTYASRSYIAEALSAGIKIYFFQPGMLHSKLLIVDDNLASMGSSNFDFRSFEHNFEANLMIYTPDAVKVLTEIFLADMKESIRIRPQQWRHRSLLSKVLESVTRLLSPIL